MALPGFREFVDPVLRYLARKAAPVQISEVYEGVAAALGISEEDRRLVLSSGGAIYDSRVRWAFGWLKRAGLGRRSNAGEWELTSEGRTFAIAHPVFSDVLFDKYDEKVRPSTESRSTRPKQRKHPAKNEARMAYRLPPQPLAEGAQSRVYEATRKSDGQIFVMKREKRGFGGRRMRREIEVQTSLSHQHIMPIIDWDQTDFQWFVMPKGIRSLEAVKRPLAVDIFSIVLRSVIDALRFAHDAGHPHRDLKPQNIIELREGDTNRWVLADWGLTRRPLGQTTSPLTRSGQLLGTEGFAPPEAYYNAHYIGPAGDIYSLGQLIAWATGVDPIPNVSPVVSAPWTEVVKRMTRHQAEERPQTISELQQLLSSVEFL